MKHVLTPIAKAILKLLALTTVGATQSKILKIGKLWTFDLSYFLCQTFCGYCGFQNMLVYEPMFITLILKEGKVSDYVIASKSKALLKTEL